MPEIAIRPFRRDDRGQLTALVNAHVAAVVPGLTVSVNAVMSQLEREPGEWITDPWVVERRTLVAVERAAVVAGAHLHRYGDGENVGPDYRNAASLHWLVFGHRREEAAGALIAECLALMDAWGARVEFAGGELPAIATYGVPSTWPHIRDLYLRTGFVHDGKVEIVLVAEIERLPSTAPPPVDGLDVVRSVGDQGTRFTATLGGERVGLIEVELLEVSDLRSRQFGWADIGNLWVAAEHRRRGIGTWLLGIAADWLRLGGIERLLAYAWPSQEDELAFLTQHRFRELVRTERGWIRRT
jgi:GNAT superfamily N-acetyltransferase